ncbi:MAG: ABC transporter, substrate-binding protein (cluster 5, nickel/peptides/opines) [uncultured Thermomicrobiales bacterium]|uniref:ABC transporter, substrate-binding protein (Cluster 5, nickel/peptides/opines) n=1 Tax=uncultured Thermomicrobiales bacterium TaxID=1645740 RepID=A0A6J4U3N0_9BACT|nr:MAG: ABC transporter, substrate-binding protein (cluster 5, nickel/peptides/opines) [uncultured Thermomicrobiales bacterium]
MARRFRFGTRRGGSWRVVYLVVVGVLTSIPVAAAQDGTPTPVAGGTMVVSIASDPGHFNPAITTGFTQHVVADSIFNGLVGLDENLQPVPDLADRWDISEDGTTYTFHLHPGVRWHDGAPFTSADVKFSFEEVLLQYHSRTAAGLTPVLAGIDAPNDLTVVMRFTQPYAPLLQRLDVTEAPIVAKHVYEGTDPTTAEANLEPVGTGPYRFVEYAQGDQVTLERNEDYFKDGLPYLDRVVFRVIPEANSALQALQQGEVDYAWNTTPAQTEILASAEGIATVNAPASPGGALCINTLVFNLEHPPLDRPEVRQAIYHAIDRERMLEQIQFGSGRVATGPISSRMDAFYNPDVATYAYDVDRANALLDGAGLTADADGTRATLVFPHPNTFDRYGEIIREQLGEVGIEVEDVSLDFNAATDRVFVERDFDLGIVSYCNGTDPEIGVRRVYDSRNIRPIPFSNGAAYRNPDVDRLFDEAATTLDPAQRAAAYAEIQAILAEEVPYVWLIETEGLRAFSAEFHDFQHWSGHFAETAWTGAGG